MCRARENAATTVRTPRALPRPSGQLDSKYSLYVLLGARPDLTAIAYMYIVCPLNKNDREAMNGNMMRRTTTLSQR